MGFVVRIDDHRPKLEHVERSHSLAKALLPEEHGSRRVPADPQRDPHHQRSENDDQSSRSDDVEGPLRRSRDAGRPGGGQSQQLETFHVVDGNHGADSLEESRNEIDVDVEVAEAVDETELVLVPIVGERDDDALDVVLADETRDVVGRAEDGDAVEIGPHALGIGVDEPDEPDAELGVLAELAAKKLTDVSGPDDQGVLDVARRASRKCSSRCAGEREGHDRRRPEGDQRVAAHLELEDPRDDDSEPGAEADVEDEHAQLVERRVVELLSIAVVQPKDLSAHEPERDRRGEECEVPTERGAVSAVDDEEGEQQSQCIRCEKPATYDDSPAGQPSGRCVRCDAGRPRRQRARAAPRPGVLRRAHGRTPKSIREMLTSPTLSRRQNACRSVRPTAFDSPVSLDCPVP